MVRDLRAIVGIAAAAAALAATGCASGRLSDTPGSLGFGASTYSAPSQPSSPTSGDRPQISASHATPGVGTLVVRPDLLTMQFRLRAVDGDGARAYAFVQARVDELARRLKAATGGVGRVRMTGLVIEPKAGDAKKLATKEERVVREVLADGCVEVPLATTGDYWARARLLVALDAVAHGMMPEGDRAHPELEAAFDMPHAVVKDPEAFRDELVKRWMDRVHGFTKAAESATAKLDVLDCAAPPEITQDALNLEEVALNLRITCRVDDVRAAPQKR